MKRLTRKPKINDTEINFKPRGSRKPKWHKTTVIRDSKIEIGTGLVDVDEVSQEIIDATEIMLGREDSPVDYGINTLQELSNLYLSRAYEIQMIIRREERAGKIKRGDEWYLFRTGELRDWIELLREAQDMGSRRLTYAGQILEAERTGREAPMIMDGNRS